MGGVDGTVSHGEHQEVPASSVSGEGQTRERHDSAYALERSLRLPGSDRECQELMPEGSPGAFPLPRVEVVVAWTS